jgi:DNA-directed RNA polymerase subunit omega
VARITVEDCLDKVHNRFALVLLVAKRTKQLMKGDECTVHSRNNKHVVNSLREVAGGTVYFDTTDSEGLTPDQQVQRDLSR